jgi:hypothetical protein
VGTLFGKILDVDMAYTRNNKVLRTKIGCLDRNLIPVDSGVFIRRGFFKLQKYIWLKRIMAMMEAMMHKMESTTMGGNAMDMNPKGTDEEATYLHTVVLQFAR